MYPPELPIDTTMVPLWVGTKTGMIGYCGRCIQDKVGTLVYVCLAICLLLVYSQTGDLGMMLIPEVPQMMMSVFKSPTMTMMKDGLDRIIKIGQLQDWDL